MIAIELSESQLKQGLWARLFGADCGVVFVGPFADYGEYLRRLPEVWKVMETYGATSQEINR